MAKFVVDVLFGLGFGVGFCLAQAVLNLIGSLITNRNSGVVRSP